MRDLINIVLRESAAYDHFIAMWGDHMPDELPSEDEYRSERDHIVSTGTFIVYRGIRVLPEWLTGLGSETRLGTSWSTDWTVAEDFTGAMSGYDDRFDAPGAASGVIRVIMQAEVEVGNVDVDASVASTFATSEQEIRVYEDHPVTLTRLWVEGKWVEHPAVGQVFNA